MGIKNSRMGGYGLDLCGSLQEPELGICEHHNEPFSAVKCRESLNQMRNLEG